MATKHESWRGGHRDIPPWGIVLFTLLTLLLFACAGDTGVDGTTGTDATSVTPTSSVGGSTTSDDSGAADAIALDLISWQAEEAGFADWWGEIIEAFEADHPGVTVSLQQVQFDQFMDTMTTRFLSDDPPEIVHLPLPGTSLAQFVERGWLEPLDSRLAESDVPQNWPTIQSESMSWEGQVYGVLLSSFGYVLYYNADLLGEAGFDGPPTTLDELLAAAEAITSQTDAFGWGDVTTQSSELALSGLSFVVGTEAEWIDNGQWALTNPGVVNAIDAWRTLAKENAPLGIGNSEKRELFWNGEIGMTFDGPWVLASRDSAPADVAGAVSVSVAPFPTQPGAASNSLHIPANMTDEVKNLAWDFIELATTEEWQVRYSELTSTPAPRSGADEVLRTDPDGSAIADAAAAAVDIVGTSQTLRSRYEEFSDIVGGAFITLLTSDTDTGVVLQSLQDDLVSNSIVP
jgi:multiple sugar transport system substrate-binding protein